MMIRMNIMKGLLSAVVLLMLVSCSGSKPKVVDPTIVTFPIYTLSDNDDKNIVIVEFEDWPQERIYLEAIESFNKENEEIQVVPHYLSIGRNSLHMSQLDLLKGDNPPDIIRFVSDYLFHEVTGHEEALLTDLSIWRKGGEMEIPEFIIDWGIVDGKLQILPASLNPTAIVVNQQVLDQANIPYPGEVLTWERFGQLVRQINESGDELKGFDSNPISTLAMLLNQTGEAIVSEDMTTASGYLDSSAAIRIMEWMSGLYNFDVERQRNGTNTFAPGNVATGISGMNFYHGESNDGVKIGFIRYPHFEGMERTVPVSFGGYSISAKSEHPQEAWAFIRYLNQKINEHTVKLAASRLSSNPKLVEEAIRVYDPPHMRFFMDEIKYAVYEEPNQIPPVYWSNETAEQIKNILQASPEEMPQMMRELALELDRQLQLGVGDQP